MTIDSIGKYDSTPPIRNFPQSISAMENSQKQLKNTSDHERIYHSSIASCEAPLWTPGKDSVVESLSIRGNVPPPDVQKGFFNKVSDFAYSAFDKIGNAVKSAYDTVYTFIWGVSPYARAQAASEATMSETQRKRIADAIDAMIKALERIQEVAKEEGAEEASSEDKKKFFSFVEILKNDAIIVKQQLADHAETINILNKENRDNQKKSRVAREKMHESSTSGAIAGNIVTISTIFTVVAGIFNTAEAFGYGASACLQPWAPALVAIGRLGSIAAVGLGGASKMAATSFEGQRIKQELAIEVLKNANQKNDLSVKNYSQDIGTLNQNIAIPDSYIIELIKSLEALQNSMLDYK